MNLQAVCNTMTQLLAVSTSENYLEISSKIDETAKIVQTMHRLKEMQNSNGNTSYHPEKLMSTWALKMGELQRMIFEAQTSQNTHGFGSFGPDETQRSHPTISTATPEIYQPQHPSGGLGLPAKIVSHNKRFEAEPRKSSDEAFKKSKEAARAVAELVRKEEEESQHDTLKRIAAKKRQLEQETEVKEAKARATSAAAKVDKLLYSGAITEPAKKYPSTGTMAPPVPQTGPARQGLGFKEASSSSETTTSSSAAVSYSSAANATVITIDSKSLEKQKAEWKARAAEREKTQSGDIKMDKPIKPINLFVRGFPSEWNEQTLIDVFGKPPYGPVLSSKVMRNDFGFSRGMGFVRMSSMELAQITILDFDGKEHHNLTAVGCMHPIHVSVDNRTALALQAEEAAAVAAGVAIAPVPLDESSEEEQEPEEGAPPPLERWHQDLLCDLDAMRALLPNRATVVVPQPEDDLRTFIGPLTRVAAERVERAAATVAYEETARSNEKIVFEMLEETDRHSDEHLVATDFAFQPLCLVWQRDKSKYYDADKYVGSNVLFIKGLPTSFKAVDVNELCSLFGKVQNVKIVGKKGGTFVNAFVQLRQPEEALLAARSLSGANYNGCSLDDVRLVDPLKMPGAKRGRVDEDKIAADKAQAAVEMHELVKRRKMAETSATGDAVLDPHMSVVEMMAARRMGIASAAKVEQQPAAAAQPEPKQAAPTAKPKAKPKEEPAKTEEDKPSEPKVVIEKAPVLNIPPKESDTTRTSTRASKRIAAEADRAADLAKKVAERFGQIFKAKGDAGKGDASKADDVASKTDTDKPGYEKIANVGETGDVEDDLKYLDKIASEIITETSAKSTGK